MEGSRLGTRCLSAAGALIVGVALFVATTGVSARQQADAAQPASPAQQPTSPAQLPADAPCRISGTITGLGNPLPGVAITARKGYVVQTASSTSVEGAYKLSLPDGVYQLTIGLTGFESVQRDVTVSREACAQAIDATLTLAARLPVAAASGGGRGAGPATPGQAAAAAAGGRGAGTRGFETLAVTEDTDIAALTAALNANAADSLNSASSPLQLPPGFDSEASANAFAVTGDAARVNNGLLNDRRDAINRGDFQLANADAAGAFGADGGGNPTLGGLGGQGGGGRGGGRGGNANNFQLGGRGGRQQGLTMQSNYSFRGSPLNSAPKQLRTEVRGAEKPTANHNFGTQLGGPIKIPGIYENTTNRSTFTLQYSGNTGTQLFDQYATVPTAAMRAGDFSASNGTLIDPATGQPFEGNRIPTERMSREALALLGYFPDANLDGTTRNYHYSTTTASKGNNLQIRINHNFSGTAAGGRGGGRGGGGGGGGGQQQQSNAGRAGQGRRLLGTRTNVTMNASVTYNNSDNFQNNVFSNLGGRSKSTTFGLPVSFNVQRGRTQHQLNVTFNKTTSATTNQFTNATNISALAGIAGVSDDPFAYGLPRLTFSSISGLTDTTPSRRDDKRMSASYTYTHPFGRHSVQSGGDFRYDVSSNNTEANANGAFVFTGLYTSNGGNGGLTGFDFADFLLGMPQQASINYGPGNTTLTGRSMSLYVQDEWRARPSLTFNLGVRYELLWPFIEENGQLVNLDVTPDFTAAAPVEAGQVGAFSGAYPAGLLLTDTNNVAPRMAFAWRAPRAMIVRGGYTIQYNSGGYSAIARQLAQQPPFATSGTNIGSLSSALLLENALTGISPADTRNNYGVDKDYVLGTVQTWNIDMQRTIGRSWQASGNYTHTRGSNLDIVRAPNRNVDGSLRIDGVQPFTWQSAEGRSVLNSATFRLQKQQTRGVGYSAQYTIAKSRDNSPSIGGGGGGSGNIAQNDQDIESEWAQSSFVQRHQVQLQLNAQLPFGEGRRWLTNGGFLAAMLDRWQFTLSFTARSGNPLTARVTGAARDVSSGVSGALRGDYNGQPIEVDNPTIDRYFNTDAFSVPTAGLFGSSPRNIIIGPGSRSLTGRMQRAIPLGGNRSMNVSIAVNNLLNMVNYSSVDTNVNSPTFGQVRGISGMRSATLQLTFRPF